MSVAELALPAATYRVSDLIQLFDVLFRESHGTVLVKGEHEPIYLPRSAECPYHRIVFAHGYFASALHEIAHWSVAGQQRRQLEDFGYWYQPDGRSEEQQRLFEQVEVKPQALEWIYSVACGHPFRFSADNLDGPVGDMGPFKRAVHGQVLRYLEAGLPNARVRRLVAALRQYYGQPPLRPEFFERP